MAEFKLTIADSKTGKCFQRTVGEPNAKNLIGMKIGDPLKGEAIDLPGYEFVITGGSDYCGFPMRKGISGARKRILIVKGVGFKGGRKGEKRRKTVCGDRINEKISQVNLKVVKEGKAKLAAEKAEEGKEAPKKEEKPAKEEKPKAEEKPKEKPKEEKKEAEEKKEPEKPKEEPKK
ncbi:30S ribosomal protein S6e [Candidatus Woesearchaeota archaeon]|nr:30S ribosomal protein S6e [Candidatus Woesearchaeota archaeon]